MRTRLILALVLGLLAAGAAPARAQQLGVVQSDVIVIDIDRLLAETAYGQRLEDEIRTARDDLIARNDRLASELEAEETDLTELRATTPPAEFRAMADAFDARVTQLRRESEQLSRDLERRRELAPVQFMRVVRPVLAALLQEADAVALLDLRGVILHDAVADVTDLAIARIDARIGRGPDADPPAEPGPPD